MGGPLDGQVALVTGGGTGIGRGIGIELGRSGAAVTLIGRRRRPLEESCRAVGAEGGRATAAVGDVSVAQDVERIVDETLEREGRIDILVNNAGVGSGAAIDRHDIEVWDRVMATNLRGPFLTARYVLPGMRQRGSGHIINISSESGLMHYEGDGAYGISKHALNALSEYIQVENQAYGIRVDTICPGMVVTPMTEHSPGLDHSKCLYPEDIADLVLWLVTRRRNIKIGTPILIQTMANPWESD